VDSVGAHGANCLHVAVFGGYEDIVRMLLDHGADYNAQTTEMLSTPLHLVDKKVNLISLLLKYGADPFVKDKLGNTPISLAPESVQHIFQGIFRVECKLIPIEGATISQGKATSKVVLNNISTIRELRIVAQKVYKKTIVSIFAQKPADSSISFQDIPDTFEIQDLIKRTENFEDSKKPVVIFKLFF